MDAVLIFGAGPAGLAVAEAMRAEGVEVVGIYTTGESNAKFVPRKSVLYGAQFLHGEFKGSRVEHGKNFIVQYELNGRPDEYTRKVYGDEAPLGSSAQKYPDGYTMPGWDIRYAYEQLWRMWASHMHSMNLYPAVVRDMVNSIVRGGRRIKIISTIPRSQLCFTPREHLFASQSVWAIGDAEFPPVKIPDNHIVMSGASEQAWYRMAKIQGHTTIEWPFLNRPPIENVVAVQKPLHHRCICWEGFPIEFLGRYGEWKKSVLVHEVYEQARTLARA